MKIIQPDGVISGELSHTYIYGDGAHSRDLRNKGLLPTGTEEHPAHHVILPIITVESAVLELLDTGISQQDIISWAGVMAKAPNGIPSVHALWGPAAMTKLKIAIAMETFGNENVLMQRLLEKMASRSIRIIETNKPEHDSKMAVIQGLINLWLVMVGEEENDTLRSQVLEPWKTPVGTIVDMIHANPFAEIVVQRFFQSLPRHNYNASTALEESIAARLTEGDREKFGTPNSDRVMEFIAREGEKIILRKSRVGEIRGELNTNGHQSLAKRIQKIRDGK